MKLRDYPDKKEARGQLAKSLLAISELYGFPRPSAEAAIAMAQIIIEEYGSLHMEEIAHIFRIASKGKLNIQFTTFGQSLNMTLLDSVLMSYIKMKRKWLKQNEERLRAEKRRQTPVLKITPEMKKKIKGIGDTE